MFVINGRKALEESTFKEANRYLKSCTSTSLDRTFGFFKVIKNKKLNKKLKNELAVCCSSIAVSKNLNDEKEVSTNQFKDLKLMNQKFYSLLSFTHKTFNVL
ncbi:MAG: hypothetical protein NZ895_03865 [Archaeoglobaceae archaeon]|nr:hypothetical protein [Archaeoglobaceae archaeon]MCX8152445.1 hypothetical protein [Archaeoglobaceae archaeon]MDW8013785.1 hypothetical protein [Archaeoglobaceae archaeon]